MKKGIKIYYDHPISNSSIGNDLEVLKEMEISNMDFFNLCTNCFEFLDAKYLWDKTVDFIQVIYGDSDDHWLYFKLNEKNDKYISCYYNGKLFYENIRPVNNIRKMWRGGLFDKVEGVNYEKT